MRRKIDLNKFWSKVIKSNGCWEWTGARWGNGYGCYVHNGKRYRAHRISWEMNHDRYAGKNFVCHHCDNPPCVRPDHLFLGDARLNQLDASGKGRTVKGRTYGPLSEERKAKISASKIGKKLPMEARVNMRMAQLGRKHTIETRLKISTAIKAWRAKQ